MDLLRTLPLAFVEIMSNLHWEVSPMVEVSSRLNRARELLRDGSVSGVQAVLADGHGLELVAHLTSTRVRLETLVHLVYKSLVIRLLNLRMGFGQMSLRL